MAGRKRSFSSKEDQLSLHKECDEAVCSICMDHPHNAVLLLCSSHKKGCRSYMCDTSYRHSNCLDRFKSTSRNLVSRTTSDLVEDRRNNIPIRHSEARGESALEARVVETLAAAANSQETSGKNSLKCPLCRGNVHGWKVVEEARSYLNLKTRSCSDESCSFRGNYRELREHARRIHPAARPTEVDPSRQRAWRRNERRWEYADIVSTIRAAMPGSTVFGDYVIENEEDRAPAQREGEGEGEGEGERDLREDVPGPLWTTFFLLQMIGSLEPGAEARGRGRGGSRSRAWSRLERPAAPSSRRRRYMWGENLLGLQDENDDEDDDDGASSVNMESDEGEDGSPVPRRRRRLIQSRSDEDQS